MDSGLSDPDLASLCLTSTISLYFRHFSDSRLGSPRRQLNIAEHALSHVGIHVKELRTGLLSIKIQMITHQQVEDKQPSESKR